MHPINGRTQIMVQQSNLKLATTLDNDYGIKYERQEDITHLIDALKAIYKISEDWDGKLYCSINLKQYY